MQPPFGENIYGHISLAVHVEVVLETCRTFPDSGLSHQRCQRCRLPIYISLVVRFRNSKNFQSQI